MNRQHLLETMHRFAASGRTGTVMFLDMDGFKGINDRYGHVGGDVVLQQVAERISSVVVEPSPGWVATSSCWCCPVSP